MAVGPDGNLYVTGFVCVRGFGPACAEGSYYGVWVFSSAGRRLRSWRTDGDDGLEYGTGIGIDSSGDVYVAKDTPQVIARYRPDGTFVSDWSVPGYAGDIALDQSGNRYVLYIRPAGLPIGKFAPDGSAITDWPALTEGHDELPYELNRVVVEPSGSLLVTWVAIHRLDADGALVTSWGDGAAGATAVATDAAGNVYAVSLHSDKVTKYAQDGTELARWDAGARPYDGFKAIALDSSGSVYVSDSSNEQITKFSPNGQVLVRFGAGGA